MMTSAPAQPQNQDPISKCKDLMPQFKQTLGNLMQQLTTILSPSSTENSNNVNNENQFQLLGKYIENFNRICDALIVNLRVACEIQQLQYLSSSCEKGYIQQNADPKLQMNRIMEIRSILQRYINTTRNQNE